ncbi:MAG: peptide-methionine (S)-S-oxide reductase MsrA [Phormidesmis sp.]
MSKRFLTSVLIGFSVLLLGLGTVGCSMTPGADSTSEAASESGGTAVSASTAAAADQSNLKTAVFAGGCFWCMEKPFDKLPGVATTTSGYTGGTVENPTYNQVSAGGTGHYEAMEVRYDPERVSYETLLETFWYNVDPVDGRGQFCDKGDQYRSAVFYETPEQRAVAEASKAAIAQRLDQPIATEILPASTFYDAEGYHQNYYKTHPVRYEVYRFGCGRDQRLSDLWGADAPAHD